MAKFWKQTVSFLGLTFLTIAFSLPAAPVTAGKDIPSFVYDVEDSRPQLFRVAPQPASPASHNQTKLTVTYTGNPPTLPKSGGDYINSIHVQGVYLGPAFGTGQANASDVTFLDGYLSYIVGSSYMSALSAYGVSTGTASAGKVFTATLPHYTSSNRVYVTDTQIQNILVSNLSSLIPPASNTVYVVYTEPGIAINAGGGQTSINAFLGYHNYAYYTSGGATHAFAYAVMPYPGTPNPSPTSQGFSSARDELTSVTSHEISEAATDPDTIFGWMETVVETDTYTNSNGQIVKQLTRNLTGEEIGDVPLILYNWSPTCFTRLNGYLVQRMIGPDGKTMLTYPGSSPNAASIAGLVFQAFGVSVP